MELALELLSPNVYINHSHLDVHPPHPPTGAHRRHRDNGLIGVESPDDGALEVVPRSHLDTESRYPTEEQSAPDPRAAGFEEAA